MEKNRIEIAVIHKIELTNHFRTSRTTVQQALDFYNNSDLAKMIRAKAKELLLEEASKVN